MPRFRPAEHIRRRAEFQQIYSRGVRVHSRYTTVFLLANAAGVGRLGIAATRKFGGAVARNRVDVVVIPKRELLDASLSALEADYCALIERTRRTRRDPSL